MAVSVRPRLAVQAHAGGAFCCRARAPLYFIVSSERQRKSLLDLLSLTLLWLKASRAYSSPLERNGSVSRIESLSQVRADRGST